MTCTYKVPGNDKPLTLPELKAYLVNGGLDTLYPNGLPWESKTNTELKDIPSDAILSEQNKLFSEDDIPYKNAYDAYSGISFDPEKRAKQEQEGYVKHMQSAYDNVIQYAKNDEQKQVIEEAFIGYKNGYIKRNLSHLAAKSRVISPMITGPANFPVSRNKKANAVEHKRLTELLDWDEKARERLIATSLDYRTVEEKTDEGEAALKHVLSMIFPREAKVICYRFGLLGEKKKTFIAIGKILKLHPQTVRGVFLKAIRKLRHPSRSIHVKNITHLDLKKEVLGEDFESES